MVGPCRHPAYPNEAQWRRFRAPHVLKVGPVSEGGTQTVSRVVEQTESLFDILDLS